MFWIVLSIGPESFLEAHPNAFNFELKSPTNMHDIVGKIVDGLKK